MKKEERDSSRRRKPLAVVCSKGVHQRFLRGMVTHDLVQRGLSFDDAYAAAHAIRDRLTDHEEVSTAEIRDLIQEHLEGVFGSDLPSYLLQPVRPVPERFVIKDGVKQPFSRGVLARSIYAAGLDLDRAYRLVGELEQELREEGVTVSRSDEIARRVAEILERLESAKTSQRYWLMRRIHRLPRPLVIYLGGASGTGKSTLALEMAPLLRIYRITSTDTIRQMMRMVFSPAILPALHSSSFEVAPAFGQEPTVEDRSVTTEDDFAQRLTATFEEQATRVCVGVRAVVERSIAESMSILVEGVHLYPPLVPFGDLEGAVYQISMMLATPDIEAHRARFLARGRTGLRRAERYVESFESIRTVHDFLLQQAETHDVPLLDTSFAEPPVVRGLRLVTSMLQKRNPALAQPEWSEIPSITPTLLLVIDGLADRPVRALGGRTPLQAAETPTLDRLAKEGQCGLADPVAPGVVPDTAAGSLALFGQSPLALKRGPVEALGAGIELSPGDIALRGNFATLDGNNQVVDRRAGRIREETEKLAKAIDRLPLPGLSGEAEVRVKAATEHRLAIVLRGDGLSSAIQGSDPGDGSAPGPPLAPEPVDPGDERAVETARVLALFEQKARKVLARHAVNKARKQKGLPPANIVLTRGAGRIHHLLPLEDAGIPLRLTCIAGDRTVLGLAELLGAVTVSQENMTANLDTDLDAKFEAAAKALKRSDLVMVHVKGADIAAHDQRPDLKVSFLEQIDSALGTFLERYKGDLRVAVAADHATLSESGQHAADPLPVLIWGQAIEADDVESFDETSVAAGELQQFPLQMLLERLFELS
ncbi:MAG: 2,3-bisphosphoglycerate-independent phosphoglycerate mutase [bacterium]|nr:2,3-bisphosphoglycerate-independent phosphoglycerate mutase [bacterium]